MSGPQIITGYDPGQHNRIEKLSRQRVRRQGGYKDQSTVIVCPTRGAIPARVVESWMNLVKPMNQGVVGPIMLKGMEVGEAYCQAVDFILGQEQLRTWKYMLTIEEDNLPPPNGLLMLLEAMEAKEQWGAVGGLYWTKGPGGQPMIYGDPRGDCNLFQPQVPRFDAIQECNGLGMGFTLFRIDMFKDERIERPLFKTAPNHTQDLYFFGNARRQGYRFASHNGCRVGHLDAAQDIVW